MRLGKAWTAAVAALALCAGAAVAQERLMLEAYPPAPPSNAAWEVVTDRDLGGRFYVEMMPSDQSAGGWRDLLIASSFPHVKASAVELLQGVLRQFGQDQQCEGPTLTGPTPGQEHGRTVAYAEAYCGQQTGQAFGVQVFYKAIQGDDAVYVISRDFRVPPSRQGGSLSFAEGQQDQALALLKAVGAAKSWLAGSVYLCGASAADPRCSGPAPSGAQVLVSGGELAALAKSALYQALVDKAVQAVPPEVAKDCPALSVDRSTIMVLKPVSFAQDGLPFDGSWKQSFPQGRCGPTLNFLFSANAEQKIRTLILVPGDDIAEPEAQVEAFRSAVASVHAASAACQGLHVLDTRFEAFDHAGGPGRDPPPGARPDIPWRETWTLGGCDSAWTVPVVFTPASGGVQVVAGAAAPRP